MKYILGTTLILSLVLQAFADYKITQQTIMEGMTMETTVYAKGVRHRRETKMTVEGLSAEEMATMANMMPPSPTILTQCDLKQNVTINDKARKYYIDYYDVSSLTPEQRKRVPEKKAVIKGTSTIASVVTDSGKRQQMFGLTAKWLKVVQSVENSADSCDGKSSVKIEREGWYVDLALSQESCQTPPSTSSTGGGCSPKLVMQGAQEPGFLLEGTTKSFENNKPQGTTSIKTTALSNSSLDIGLFEIPKAYTEVKSLSDLMGMKPF